MKTKTSFTKENAPNKGLFGVRHPRWKGGISSSTNYSKDYQTRTRNAVVEALGAKCVVCGFDDVRALQIDHIEGGGSKERKERSFNGQFNNHVLKSFLNKEDKYQLLCANCNWIKRREKGENRGYMTNN